MPIREELEEVKTVKDMAEVINYYDNLVTEWEHWGLSVEKLLEVDNDTNNFRKNLSRKKS